MELTPTSKDAPITRSRHAQVAKLLTVSTYNGAMVEKVMLRLREPPKSAHRVGVRVKWSDIATSRTDRPQEGIRGGIAAGGWGPALVVDRRQQNQDQTRYARAFRVKKCTRKYRAMTIFFTLMRELFSVVPRVVW